MSGESHICTVHFHCIFTFLSAFRIDEDNESLIDSIHLVPLDAHPAPSRPHHVVIAIYALIAWLSCVKYDA